VSPGKLSFELPGRGRVLFTERVHGNMSSATGLEAEHAERARERLRADIGVRHLARARQVHGGAVERVFGGDPENAPAPSADGLLSTVPGVGVMVLTADCLPVALHREGDRGAGARAGGDQGAVAILHAGWRGLAAGVIEEGVRAIRAPGRAGELIAIVGPGAGACCYEVGEEVHAAFGGAHRHGRLIDLGAIARDRLLAAGVAEVRVLDLCTICERRFFSHRREGAGAGRQGGVAWLN
jgi:polyphenol oxidase